MNKYFLKILCFFTLFLGLWVSVFADAPVITDFSGSIDENSANWTSVLTHTWSDADGDTITYDIIDWNTGSDFSIDSNTAEITVSG
jgi:hypothetical protein